MHFGSTRLRHTMKINCIKFQIVDPEIYSASVFLKFAKHLQEICSFLVTLQLVDGKPATPVKGEFVEICRRATFLDIEMYIIEFSMEFRM